MHLCKDATLHWCKLSLSPVANLRLICHRFKILSRPSKVPVLSPQEAERQRSRLIEACGQFPEFLPGAHRLVLGSFGALGNPSSFHHPEVRRCRLRCMQSAIDLFRCYLQRIDSRRGQKLELLWDRLCWRKRGDKLGYETAHRDISKHKLEQDEVFGGWLNLDPSSQYFHCVPGSHCEALQPGRSGFCREASSSVEVRRMQRVEVPCGHMVVFYQHILHEVPRQVITVDSLRLFVGWRLTSSLASLQDLASEASAAVPDTDEVICLQAVPLLPSGQSPPMYGLNHASFWPKRLEAWCERSIHHACKSWAKRGGTLVHLVPRHLSSLAALGMPLYPAYSEEERGIMWPKDFWTLEGRRLFLTDTFAASPEVGVSDCDKHINKSAVVPLRPPPTIPVQARIKRRRLRLLRDEEIFGTQSHGTWTSHEHCYDCVTSRPVARDLN
eukprot:TRINITY_DN19677_c0_g1_i2.p1 TRINITY_DN19677_c0_g1~~TRINITY_DN19677_c0_g1_i2.p1  ORF type:complete len:441 (-),score=40.93 TRINITY_DN19677_c0_g1_i2:25-1347(-)